LKYFDKRFLKAEEQTNSLDVYRITGYFNEANNRRICETGDYQIVVGQSSASGR
jgi:hypothetical protein